MTVISQYVFPFSHLARYYLLPGLAVALQLLHGDIEQLRREYMVLFTRGVSITRKLGFSDVIMPGRAEKKNPCDLQKEACLPLCLHPPVKNPGF